MSFSQGAFAAASTAAFPLMLIKSVKDESFRRSLAERMGGGKWRDVGQAALSNAVWCHAASVGEVEGLTPVVKKLREFAPDLPLVISTTSATGRETVLKRGLSGFTCFFPYDHPLVLKRVLGNFSPKVFVVFETELWPNLFFALRRKNIPVMIVNGRISDRSYPNYRRVRALFAPALGAVDSGQADLGHNPRHLEGFGRQ